jgi:hypothetical protein
MKVNYDIMHEQLQTSGKETMLIGKENVKIKIFMESGLMTFLETFFMIKT